MSTPLIRVCAVKGTKWACSGAMSRAAHAVFLLGEHDDRATLGRFVGSEASCAASASSALGHAADRQELRRLAVAERDRAGLVEQQRVDVARRLDRAARHGEHVEADEAVHAGDADRRQAARRSSSGSASRTAPPARRRGSCRPHSARSSGSSPSAKTKMMVMPASRMLSAISFGVFCRSAPSTSPIMRSRKVEP